MKTLCSLALLLLTLTPIGAPPASLAAPDPDLLCYVAAPLWQAYTRDERNAKGRTP
jgi:hypothetical protein